MTKIVINRCFGDFRLSQEAFSYVNINGGFKFDRDVKRDNERLIEFIETNSSEIASGKHSNLKIVEIPDGVKWAIEGIDGIEWVAEARRFCV